MKNGTIYLWKYDANSHSTWFRRFVSKCIVYFTKSEYTHVAVAAAGMVYESTIWSEDGLARMGARVGSTDGVDVALVPVKELTSLEAGLLLDYCQLMVGSRMKYNILKLVSLMWIYPTRWFWNRIGWVPFDAPMYYGDVCSGFVDSAFKYAGIDLLPREHEGYTVPGDFLKSELLEKYFELR